MLSWLAPSGVLPAAVSVIGRIVGVSGKTCHKLKESHTEITNSERGARWLLQLRNSTHEMWSIGAIALAPDAPILQPLKLEDGTV
jgi:hypothetical protein